jgi:regulation of enolase protein 1 (concanavalin A-like superfamily)
MDQLRRSPLCERPLALLALASLTCTDWRPPTPFEEVERHTRKLVVAETWSHQDIGGVAAPGSFGESAGAFSVTGSGADIWGTADEMHFLYRPIAGNTTITARVTSLQNTNVWTKAAVMIREDLGAGAKNVATLLSPTATNKYRRQVRSAAGGTTTSTSSTANSALDTWVRLQRVGSSFSAFHSSNGTTWTAIGSAVTVSMASTVLVGLAVTSHADGTLATGTFDRVTVTGASPAPPAGPLALYLESENGTSTSPLQTLTDSTASNGLYVQVTPGNNSGSAVPTGGHATFPFIVTTAGDHKVWGRVIAPTTSDDSFWVRVDTQPWVQWNNIVNGTGWHWDVVHNSAAGDAVVLFNLAAGSHTLEIAYREDGTKLDRLLITNQLGLVPSDAAERPAVSSVTPAPGATGVSPGGFLAAEVTLPNLGGVDEATLTSANVNLRRVSDSTLVAATLNTSGGGDVIVLQPTAALAPQTQYRFTVTDGLEDLSGDPFLPFTSTFTTGGGADAGAPAEAAFDKISLGTTAAGFDFTSVTIGPDSKLYAATLSGEIIRWSVNGDGTLTGKQTITSIVDAAGSARAVIGLQFDPAATSGNLILWVTHGAAALTSAPDWSGKLSKLTGANLTGYQDVVVNFPRSFKDHMTNSIAFKAGEPGVLYINQGSMTAMGAPDNAWGQRAEHLLAGAVLRVDTSLLPGTLPLNIQTNDSNPTSSGYNPFAASAPVTLFASGVRNAYDLVWHSNGELYVPTNGSAAGGNTPPTPGTLPSACTRRIDDAFNGDYTGPQVPGITNVTVAQDDFLFRVVANGYYGHPNPFRCEWVMNGGNPTSGTDPAQVTQYPTSTQPDRNWRGSAFNFGAHLSPNGVIEWKSDSFFPAMKGKLLVIRYSGGDDIIVLTINPVTKNISGSQTGIPGASGFDDPLDLAADPASGRIYVTEHGGRKITLLRPRP